MSLPLHRVPPSGPPQRLIKPACLQARAPLSYDIREENGRRVPPTLTGYKLRRGRTYQLCIRTQDASPRCWRVSLLAPRSALEAIEADELDGDRRCLRFHVVRHGHGELWPHLASQRIDMPVQLVFADGREPYRFSIPVVLLPRRFFWLATFLVPTVLAYPLQIALSNSWPNVDLIYMGAVGAATGGIFLFVLLGVLVDGVRSLAAARRVLAAARPPEPRGQGRPG